MSNKYGLPDIVLWYCHHYQKGNVVFGKLGIAASKRNNFDGKWWKEAALQSNIFFHRSCVATGCEWCAHLVTFGLLTFDTQLHLQKAIRPLKSRIQHLPTKVHREKIFVRTCFPIPLPIFKRYVINYRGILVILVMLQIWLETKLKTVMCLLWMYIWYRHTIYIH